MELILTAKKYNTPTPVIKVSAGYLKGKTAVEYAFDEVRMADPEKVNPIPEMVHYMYLADGKIDFDVDRLDGGIHIEGRNATTFENGLVTVIDFTSRTESQYSFVMNQYSGAVELWRR